MANSTIYKIEIVSSVKLWARRAIKYVDEATIICWISRNSRATCKCLFEITLQIKIYYYPLKSKLISLANNNFLLTYNILINLQNFFEYIPLEPVILTSKPTNKPLKIDRYNVVAYIKACLTIHKQALLTLKSPNTESKISPRHRLMQEFY